MSQADKIFKKMCRDIIDNGYSSEGRTVRPRWKDGLPAHTIKQFGVVNRYDLSKEFPEVTLRPLAFKACVDEILWIFKDKSNDVSKLGSKIWDIWADEDGIIGKAYGYQLAKKDSSGEDQVDSILRQLKDTPYSRRMLTSMANQEDNREMGLHSCAWSVTFNVTDNKLNAILNQRSQDVLVANAWNVAQYAVLVHMFAHVSNLEVGELIHVIADAHIYDRHVELVEEILTREELPARELWLNPKITNFYDFTIDDILLRTELGAKKNKQIKNIPVAE